MFPIILTFFSFFISKTGNSFNFGAFILTKIELIFVRALAGLFSKRYLSDSGIINQATTTMLIVTTPPKRNIVLQPYSGSMYPATTEVIIAPVGYPAVTIATERARYLFGLYSAANEA